MFYGGTSIGIARLAEAKLHPPQVQVGTLRCIGSARGGPTLQDFDIRDSIGQGQQVETVVTQVQPSFHQVFGTFRSVCRCGRCLRQHPIQQWHSRLGRLDWFATASSRLNGLIMLSEHVPKQTNRSRRCRWRLKTGVQNRSPTDLVRDRPACCCCLVESHLHKEVFGAWTGVVPSRSGPGLQGGCISKQVGYICGQRAVRKKQTTRGSRDGIQKKTTHMRTRSKVNVRFHSSSPVSRYCR